MMSSLVKLTEKSNYLGQNQRTIKFHQEQVRIAQESGDRRGKADSLNNLGMAYHSIGQYKHAIDYYGQSLEIERELGDARGESRAWCNLGNAFYSLGQYQKAIEFHQRSLAIREELGVSETGRDRTLCSETAISLYRLGKTCCFLGQYERAIDYYRQSLAIRRELGNCSGQIKSLIGLGISYHCLGQYQQAIEAYQQSLSIAREIGVSVPLAVATLGASVRPDRALRSGEANALSNLGNAYCCLGQYQQAIDCYEQSIVIKRELRDARGIVASLNHLGKAYCCLEQYQQGIDYYGQSLLMLREIDISAPLAVSALGASARRDRALRSEEANALNNLGNAYHSLGQYQQAIEYHQQSLSIRRELGDCIGTAVSLNKLGKACCSLGEYERAITYYQSSLEIAREIGVSVPLSEVALEEASVAKGSALRSAEAHSLSGLANAYYCLGQCERATEYHQQSLLIARELGECLVL